MKALTILIVGGYGTFGGRIVELLENEAWLTLIIAGRSHDRAAAYCSSRNAALATLLPAVFDRDGDIAGQLATYRPDIVVDASGPFQAYGPHQYRVIEGCVAQRINYLDLADGAAFVDGVSTFDQAARAVGVFVLSGVSSFPVLTAAAVRRLSAGMATIDSIRGGIAPSPYAGVGPNVIQAIAGYAGQAIALRRNGGMVTAYPFTEQMRFTIAPPGLLPLRNTLFSLVDVPDLRALTKLWPEAKTIWMGAGPVPEILHCVLIILSWLVRLRLVSSLQPLAPLLHFASNHLFWGEHRGGMFVEVCGADDAGNPVWRCWHLLAEGNDGPLIPSMAVAAIVRNALEGLLPQSGARAAVQDLELEDYDNILRGRIIRTGIRGSADDVAPLYRRLLGQTWHALPAPIRDMHETIGSASAHGRATVERGSNLLARFVAKLFAFPKPATDTDVAVHFEATDKGESWSRRFGEDSFSSQQFAGRGRSDRLLCERFGPLVFAMALVADGGKMQLILRRWSAFGVPLPMWLCPRSNSYETTENGRFRFHVEISHPITGLIVRYRGWLARS